MPLSEQTLRSMAAPKMERDRDATHGNYTSYEIKELMIEWALRRSLSSFMVADTIDIDLSDVALLDIGALDSADAGEPWYSGPDMHTSLEHDMRTMQREAWLTSFLKSVGDEQILRQVRKMVEDELKKRSLLESVGDTASLLQRVSCYLVDIVHKADRHSVQSHSPASDQRYSAPTQHNTGSPQGQCRVQHRSLSYYSPWRSCQHSRSPVSVLQLLYYAYRFPHHATGCNSAERHPTA